MQNEIDKWLEEHGDNPVFAIPAEFIRQLREQVGSWQRQAAFNLQYTQDNATK